MLKEIMEKTYQNFYTNEENEIVGIVTPKEMWKIKEPATLQAYYIDKIYKIKEQLKVLGNYEPLKKKLMQYEKMLHTLTREMNKRVNIIC